MLREFSPEPEPFQSYIVKGREPFFQPHPSKLNTKKSLLQLLAEIPDDKQHAYHKRRHRPDHIFHNRKTIFASHKSVYENSLAERILEDEFRNYKTYFAESYIDEGLCFSMVDEKGEENPKKYFVILSHFLGIL